MFTVRVSSITTLMFALNRTFCCRFRYAIGQCQFSNFSLRELYSCVVVFSPLHLPIYFIAISHLHSPTHHTSSSRSSTGRPLLTAETSTIDLSKEAPIKRDTSDVSEEETDADGNKVKKSSKSAAAKNAVPLTADQAADFCGWLQLALAGKVKEVKVTTRLSDSPAIVTDHQSGALRRMMKMVVSSY